MSDPLIEQDQSVSMDETATILFVDDEQNILNAMKRLFMEDDMKILTATSGDEALDILKKNDIAAIISDNLMPGMNGIEFLLKAKALSPDAVRIMLTGCNDIQSAINAINRGEVYKFITKPWNNDEIRNVVFEAVSRHKVVQSMQHADEYMLCSLAQTIELKDAYTKGHCDRVEEYALAIADVLGIENTLKEDIRKGSWLHDCGKIGVPEAILNYDGRLSVEQMDIVKKHPCWGADVARSAHLSESVVNIILYHHEHYDGTGYPLGLKGENIPLEARIVNVADIFDALTSERPYRSKMSREKAIAILIENRGTYSDPRITDIFIDLLKKEKVT
jgi:putative nucleotidyltransferase with HDIG domain